MAEAEPVEEDQRIPGERKPVLAIDRAARRLERRNARAGNHEGLDLGHCVRRRPSQRAGGVRAVGADDPGLAAVPAIAVLRAVAVEHDPHAGFELVIIRLRGDDRHRAVGAVRQHHRARVVDEAAARERRRVVGGAEVAPGHAGRPGADALLDGRAVDGRGGAHEVHFGRRLDAAGGHQQAVAVLDIDAGEARRQPRLIRRDALAGEAEIGDGALQRGHHVRRVAVGGAGKPARPVARRDEAVEVRPAARRLVEGQQDGAEGADILDPARMGRSGAQIEVGQHHDRRFGRLAGEQHGERARLVGLVRRQVEAGKPIDIVGRGREHGIDAPAVHQVEQPVEIAEAFGHRRVSPRLRRRPHTGRRTGP